MAKSTRLKHEAPFFRAITFVTTHFIQHAEPDLYRPLVPLVESWERGDWESFSLDKKQNEIQKLAVSIDGNDQISAYFEKYPHRWSKSKFAQFKQMLEAFNAELNDLRE